MREATFFLCAAIVALLPFYLIRRWPHVGMLVSVFFGWFAIHQVNMAFQSEWSELVDAVFAGIWAVGGWVFMLVWCLPIYLYALFCAWRTHRKSEKVTPLNTSS